ncbi:MAG: family transporter, partial [Geminicoccaceae bacterium]|nr:family transporter [Geminicoccaceae bacterium]
MSTLGPIGRLGRQAALHRSMVFAAWAVLAIGLGVLAPRVEHALSGAGWQANGSESVQAREAINASLGGNGGYAIQVAINSEQLTVADPGFRAAVRDARATLAADDAVSTVSIPQPGSSISRDGGTVLIQAGAAKNPNEMVAAAADLKTELAASVPEGIDVNLTGAPGMWSDFNEANKTAMMKSELISWPVTLGILLLA